MSYPQFVRYDDDEWSALYKDGHLVVVGDNYLADEYLNNFLEIENRIGNDYFLGRDGRRENVAESLSEIEKYNRDRAHRKQRAFELRCEAAELNKRACNLEDSL